MALEAPPKPRSAWKPGSGWISAGLLIVAFALLATVIAAPFSFIVEPADRPWYLTWRVLVASVGFVIVLWGIRSRVRARTAQRGRPAIAEPRQGELLGATRLYLAEVATAYADRLIELKAAIDFAERLISPDKVRSRTVESVQVRGDTVRRTCAVHYKQLQTEQRARSGRGKPSTIYLPLVRFKRGHLVDSLSITDRSGKQVTSMSNRNYMVLIGVCVVQLMRASLTVGSRRDARRVHAMLLGQCLLNRPLTAGETTNDRTEEHLARLAELREVEVRDRVTAELLCALVALAQTTYAIVVAWDAAEAQPYFELSYAERLSEKSMAQPPPSWALGDDGWRKALRLIRGMYRQIKAEARALLGIGPVDLHVDASRAKKSSSYHLELLAPEGHYVASARFYDAKSRKRVGGNPNPRLYRLDKPYYRCPPPNGAATAHLYTRGFSERADVARPSLHVRFAEVPPGSVGRAWLVSASLLIIIWVIGVSPFYTDPKASSSPTANLSSLLFTVPIALIGVLGATARERDGLTLTSRLSLLCSSLVALASLALDQLMRADRIAHTLAWPAVAMVTHPIWISLMLATLLQVLFVGIRSLTRFFSWRRVLRRGHVELLPE